MAYRIRRLYDSFSFGNRYLFRFDAFPFALSSNGFRNYHHVSFVVDHRNLYHGVIVVAVITIDVRVV
jgi:hypothetical protein